MADPVKTLPTPAVPTPFKFDENAFQTKVISQEEYLKKFIGIKGHNPFFLLHKLLEARQVYSEGIRTETLYNSVMKMEQKAPTYGVPVLVPKPIEQTAPESIKP